MDDKENILNKARKLAAMTEARGCTAEEASLAAEKLAKLAAEYDLDVSRLLDGGKARDDIKIVAVDIPSSAGRKAGWNNLSYVIGEAFEVTTTTRKDRQSRKMTVRFVGFMADCECAGFLLETAMHQLIIAAKKLRLDVTSFLYGAAETIEMRLKDLRKSIRQETTSGCTALVTLSDRKMSAISTWIEDNMRLKTARNQALRLDLKAYTSGLLFGHQIQLNQAIGMGD